MYPLHCNKCFRRKKIVPSLELFVSRCGHVICKSCLQEMCPMCARPFTGIAINNKMPQAMADYFGDPLKLLRHFQKVTKFQYDQERSIVEHMAYANAESEKRVKEAKRNYSKLQQTLQRKLDKENERIKKYKEYIAYHERRLEQSRYMEPPKAAKPRQRYPSRKTKSDTTMEVDGSSSAVADFMAQLTQSVKSNYPPPPSPTISSNDDSSFVTGDDASEIFERRYKLHRSPVFPEYNDHKTTKKSFF